VKATVCKDPTPTKCSAVRASVGKDCGLYCPPGKTCIKCSGPFGIMICNSNGVTDDSWDIKLNGTFVANYNIGNETRALIVLPLSAQGKTVAGVTGRGCTLFNYVYSDLLDTLSGEIEMTMTIVALNGQGNYGTVEFACVAQDATTATLGATVNQVIYNGSGLGYTHTYPLLKG